MNIVYMQEQFVCFCEFKNRHLPKDAGFQWDSQGKHWTTKKPNIAARLLEHCSPEAKKIIMQSSLHVEEWPGDLSIPEGEELRDFQIRAAKFALARNKCYLALDPGLGKTPIAGVVSGTLSGITPHVVIYVCPPFLTRNVEEEFNKWAGLFTKRFASRGLNSQVVIVPDSIIERAYVQSEIRKYIEENKMRGVKSLLIVDEAHRFKNGRAKRTIGLFGSSTVQGIAKVFDRVIFMSGTPMPNRPMELYPILKNSVPEIIDHMDYFSFGLKYCAGHKTEWGWDFTGASNVQDLVGRVIGKFMLRQRKDDVLKELPPKTEELVMIDHDMTPSLSTLNSAILRKFSPTDLMEGKLRAQFDLDEMHIATYRRELGIAKVKPAVQYIKYLLEETDESLLIFALHTEVIAELNLALEKYKPIVITGQTPMGERHELVKKFQNVQNQRVFIGNIQAAGTGFTLTKATRVVFAEFSWVPGDNDQASDRAHRIGQLDNVCVQYLVYKNSVDKAVLETILKKRKVTDQL